MEVRVDVPVRACDVGGWTDTWFAGHGRVCSLAVGPGVSVLATAGEGDGRVALELVDYGLSLTVGSEPAEHRLLGEAVRDAGALDGLDVSLRVSSAVPPGCALGTSAAVVVGVIAALDLVRGVRRSPAHLAAAAHRVEAVRLGRQSGVQDQIAAAHGGANLIEMTAYPRASTVPIRLADDVARSLDDRLVHIPYGGPHDSSAVHEDVIGALEAEGASSPRLERLRDLARRAKDALEAGDLDRYGQTLTAATDAQRGLHPDLVCDRAEALIELARARGALGWKVNGAGGSGGSLSILCPPEGADGVREEAERLGHRPLDLRLARHGPQAISR